MSNSRHIEFDIEALILAAACVFLWLSLATYDPADSLGRLPGPLKSVLPNDAIVYPPNVEIHNWCGWFGALCAQLLVQALGIGSLLVAVGLTVLTVWMFRVQNNYVRASRQLGWVLVIVAATTFSQLVGVATPLSPVIGPGGYLGTMVFTWLNEHFALFGSFILTLTVFLAGMLLSTDYYILRAARMMWLGGATVATSAAAVTKKRVSIAAPIGLPSRDGKRHRKLSDVEQGVVLAGETAPSHETPPPVRIRGQQLGDNAVAESDEELVKPGVLGVAKALAAGLLGGNPVNAAESLEKPADVASSADEDVDEWEEEQFEDEFVEEGEPEFREIAVDGELILARADEAHSGTPEPAGPRVRTPRNKQAEKKAAGDSLAHLDDTKLPAGTEEYVLPGLDLLLESDDIDFEAQAIEVRRKAKILEKTFKDFGFNVKVVEIETGPVIAQYEVELEAGLRLSKITGLSDDLAIALRVPSVRIVAPIPGKNTVGIEVPNETRQVVRLREVIEEHGSGRGKKAKIPLFLGKDVSGNALTADLASLPHLLIAGRTGTGKSVCLNAIIASILMTKKPDEVRMLMIDPKMVELSGYARLPHLMHPVVTDMKKAEAILAWAVDKMEERYSLLARAGVRHLTSYNELGREEILDRLRPESPEEAAAIPDHLPFIVIVADEMADLMMTAGKEVEQHIIRLAQKSRAVGIHLILATQKPTVDVITGLIKSNLPARISFQVASRTDSRVVLDEMGADKLLGNGDMLFLWPGTSMLLRGQGTYLGDEEINAVVDHCSTGEQNFVNELVNLKIKEEDGEEVTMGALKKRDELYAAAVDVVVREGRGSCSLLQRALGIGYGRAARLIDYMAEDGLVGEYNGSQAREVLLSIADWEAMQSGDEAAATAAGPPPRASRSNKIRPDESTAPDADSVTPRAAQALRLAAPAIDSEEDTDGVADEESAGLPWQASQRNRPDKVVEVDEQEDEFEEVEYEQEKETAEEEEFESEESELEKEHEVGRFDDGDDTEYEDVED